LGAFKNVIHLINFQSLLVTWCTKRCNVQESYALPTLYVFCTYLSENCDLCHLIINCLVFITDLKSVYCAVRTGSLNTAVCVSSLKD